MFWFRLDDSDNFMGFEKMKIRESIVSVKFQGSIILSHILLKMCPRFYWSKSVCPGPIE